MKRTFNKIKVTALAVIMAIALQAHAQFPPATVPQGGTGLTAFPAGSIVTGNSTLRLIATSTNPLYIGSFVGTTTNSSSLKGNLGIGTTSPYATLSVVGTGVFNNLIATSTTASSTIATGGFTVGTNQFIVQQNSGQVGINTTNPQALLDVVGTASSTKLFVNDGSASLPTLTFAADTDTGIFRAGANLLGFATGGSEGMRLDGSGNLGIGTTTPAWKLQITTSAAQQLVLTDSSGGTNKKHFGIANIGGNLYIGTSTDAQATSTPPAFVITNGGNVGIATSAPASEFSIGNIANFTGATSTVYSSGGFNLSGGCFAINGSCVGGSSGSSFGTNYSSTSQQNLGSTTIYFDGTAGYPNVLSYKHIHVEVDSVNNVIGTTADQPIIAFNGEEAGGNVTCNLETIPGTSFGTCTLAHQKTILTQGAGAIIHIVLDFDNVAGVPKIINYVGSRFATTSPSFTETVFGTIMYAKSSDQATSTNLTFYNTDGTADQWPKGTVVKIIGQ